MHFLRYKSVSIFCTSTYSHIAAARFDTSPRRLYRCVVGVVVFILLMQLWDVKTEGWMDRQHLRRLWYHWQGEHPVLTVFWLREYPIGSVQRINRHCYRVTRYMRAIGSRFFEIWGRSTPCGTED